MSHDSASWGDKEILSKILWAKCLLYIMQDNKCQDVFIIQHVGLFIDVDLQLSQEEASDEAFQLTGDDIVLLLPQ